MELLRLHFPGVHRALREALDSLSTFASYLLGDTVPSAEGRGGNLSTGDGDRGKELEEMTEGGSQQDEDSKEILEKGEMISSKDLEDTFSSRGSETREAWEKGKEKKARGIQELEAKEIWEIGKEVGVDLNEEMTGVCTTWDGSNENSKEAKGKIGGNHKIEVQEARCMLGTEPKQAQKTDAVEARECKKEGILAAEYLETKGFVSEEKGGREPKAQGKKNQFSKKEVNVGKAENYWKEEETEPVGEQKEKMEEIKPGHLEGRALIGFGVESENGIIWEKEKEDRRAQELKGNVRDWQEAKESEKAQRMKKDSGQKLGMETRKSHEIKKVPDGAMQGGFGENGIVETPEKQEVEKHEVREAPETQRIEISCEKKEMDKEEAWEAQGVKPVERDIEKLQGVQEPKETEGGDSVKSEVWITSVMEKAESREAVKLRAAETSPKKEAEEAWKAEDKESHTKWDVEVIRMGWDTEEVPGEDLEKKKEEEREAEENLFPKQVQTQRTEREEEVADFGVLEKKEIVQVLESEVEVEGSSGLEGEAGERCENQSEQIIGQDIKETKIWEGTLNNISRSKEIESVEVEEVMGGCKVEPGRAQEVEQTETDDSDETSVTRPEKEVGGAKLMREAEVGKSRELEAKDKKSHETERVKEDQDSEEIGVNWNMEAKTGRAQETEKEPRKVQDLKEEELKGKEEEPFRISERNILEGCEIGTSSAQNIKNTENGNVQEMNKHDSISVEGWKTMEGEFESCKVTEIKDKGGSEGEEEDKGNQEAKESQEFKEQEVPMAEIKTSWGTKEAGTTEPEIEEKELEESQEAQGDRGHQVGESEVKKLKEREAKKAREYWEVEGEVIGSQQMKEIEGSQETEGESSSALERKAEVWQGNARSLWDTERENEEVRLNLKEAEDGRSQETEQKVKRDWKEIKRDWDLEEAISQKITEVRESQGSNLLEVGVREALEEEKGYRVVEGTEEGQTTGRMTDRDQVVEKSEIGRTWEWEEKESEGEQETGSAEAKESWRVEKEEAGSQCEKENSAFYQGAEIPIAMTNKEVELGREKEMEEGQIKSEEKPEGGQGNRDTKQGLDGESVNSESTWALEEETQCEGDTQTETKAWGTHAVEGETSMDNQYIEEVEANGGRRLEAVMMASRQGDGNREELEPAGCCDTERWGDGDKDSEAPGTWKSNEKPGSGWDLHKAEPGQTRGTEEVVAIDSGALEASENGRSEATAPTNVMIRLSPEPNPAEAHSSWNEAPIPGPCLDLSIPRSRVLLSRNASQRRSRPSFRRAPAPQKADSDDGEESLGFLSNEGSPASKLRLLQSEETAVPSPPKPEGTPVTARKRPLGHGFGLAHPNMMQELQARLGRPKPQ